MLDNPYGVASRPDFIDQQAEVARELGIQLIYTTAIEDEQMLSRLPNLIRLVNNTRTENGKRFIRFDNATYALPKGLQTQAASVRLVA